VRIESISLRNYRPFACLEPVRLGSLATIVGQNDTGKSTILRALRVFFDDSAKLEASDVYAGAADDAPVVIEVAFTDLPTQVELEDGVVTTLAEEMLLDAAGLLHFRRIFSRADLKKSSIALGTRDYSDDQHAGLPRVKEKELNDRCKALGIDVTKSGRGITNKSKREAIRDHAKQAGVPLADRELELTTKDDLWKVVKALFPEFNIFPADAKLGIGETTFQSQFRPIITAAAEREEVKEARDNFTDAITGGLQEEVAKIFARLQRHTEALVGLAVKPSFSWDKAVSFDLLGKDQHGIEASLEGRGSGLRRLLMVAFFEYLASRATAEDTKFVFAVEEPENCLHPGLQRQLQRSFRRLADEGHQVIVTSHSPVFAGGSPVEDLALIVRQGGMAQAVQWPQLDRESVAEELGVEPADQVAAFHACVFVEGHTDVHFLRAIAAKLRASGHLSCSFDDAGIGFALTGGENLKHWIDLRALRNLNRRFAVVIDSDRQSASHVVPQRKLNWKKSCEADGGYFHILRKRDIENYLHPAALARAGRPAKPFDDYSDMRKLFGDNVYKLVDQMTSEEILDRDAYEENGKERHELLELLTGLLCLAPGSSTAPTTPTAA